MDGVAIPEHVYCPKCAYHLYRLEGERCPECGYDLAGLRNTESGIPWVHRKKIGWLRAFWATVWLVTFRNRKFCEEYARAVDFREARKFQFAAVLQAWLPLLLATIVAYFSWPPEPPASQNSQVFVFFQSNQKGSIWDQAYVEVWPAALLVACVLVFLFLATGVQSYIFHPRAIAVARQNSAIAMSYYAAGPIASLAVGLSIGLCALPELFGSHWEPVITPMFLGLAGALLISSWAMFYATLVITIRRVLPQLPRRAIGVTLLVPLLWIVLLGVSIVLMPLVVVFPAVVVSSLG